MESDPVYPCRKRLPWRAIDTEALVVDVKSGLLYPLNSVAARIWDLCDGQRTTEEIIRAIVAEFDSDEATIRADTTSFLESLTEAKLISIARQPHGPAAAAPPAPGNQRGG